MLSELRAELDQINQEIVVMERLVCVQGRKRCGRPPKSMTLVKRNGPKGPRLVLGTGTEGSSKRSESQAVEIPGNTSSG
jgi:hypothetical protein